MAIKTARTDEVAQISIDASKCIGCGQCVKVCFGDPLYMEGKKVQVDQSRLFGCIGCGQCMAVCPEESISITGRTFSPADVEALPTIEERADYKQVYSLMKSRRSTRRFKNKPVSREDIEKIIEAVTTAPMGVPPSDVEILVFDTPEKVREFSYDVVSRMESIKFVFNPLFRILLRPIYGKVFAESAKTFLEPAIDKFLSVKKEGGDFLLYSAPAALYFHTSPYADPVDPYISATYAMLAAEALGLGSCMIGTPGHFLKGNKKIKRKYDIPIDNHDGIVLIIGHPAVVYKKSLKRSLGKITYYNK